MASNKAVHEHMQIDAIVIKSVLVSMVGCLGINP
jgi:hypothetical protein